MSGQQQQQQEYQAANQNCFERSAEGGSREVTREFGGQPFRGGGNRALDTAVIAPQSHFLWFVVRCRWFLILLFLHDFAFSTAVDTKYNILFLECFYKGRVQRAPALWRAGSGPPKAQSAQ